MNKPQLSQLCLHFAGRPSCEDVEDMADSISTARALDDGISQCSRKWDGIVHNAIKQNYCHESRLKYVKLELILSSALVMILGRQDYCLSTLLSRMKVAHAVFC